MELICIKAAEERPDPGRCGKPVSGLCCTRCKGHWGLRTPGTRFPTAPFRVGSQDRAVFIGEGTATFRDTAEARNRWDYTVAGRVGVAYERAFIYGKAGWAWGRFDFNASRTVSEGLDSESITNTGSGTLNGPMFGIGVEYALTNNWTVKGEYNYINYGLSPVSFVTTECVNGSCLASPAFSQSFSAEKHIFKFGVNYLFNVGSARY